MEKIKKSYVKYYVWQGNLTESGGGDVEIVETFDNLADARHYFNKIKEDTKGYSLHRGGRLETWLTRKKEIGDDAIDFNEYYY